MTIPALSRFFTLPGIEKQILIRACFLLSAIRLGMWLVPFRILQQTLKKTSRFTANPEGHSVSPEKVVWAVQIAGRYIPFATCLAQALTVQVLLAQEGIHSDLEIGVARNDESQLKAHAWLEIDGTVIIGGQERDRYTRLNRQQ